MNEANITKIKLTPLQEEILIEYNKNKEYKVICKNLHLIPITLSKGLQTLKSKGLIDNDAITQTGKELINYYNFRNETIKLFVEKTKIVDLNLMKELHQLDFKLIIAIRNLLHH